MGAARMKIASIWPHRRERVWFGVATGRSALMDRRATRTLVRITDIYPRLLTSFAWGKLVMVRNWPEAARGMRCREEKR